LLAGAGASTAQTFTLWQDTNGKATILYKGPNTIFFCFSRRLWPNFYCTLFQHHRTGFKFERVFRNAHWRVSIFLFFLLLYGCTSVMTVKYLLNIARKWNFSYTVYTWMFPLEDCIVLLVAEFCAFCNCWYNIRSSGFWCVEITLSSKLIKPILTVDDMKLLFPRQWFRIAFVNSSSPWFPNQRCVHPLGREISLQGAWNVCLHIRCRATLYDVARFSMRALL